MEEQVQQIASLLTQIIPKDLPARQESIYRRRLEIQIRTHLGQSQAEICSALGCSKDTARHWMTIAKTEGLNCWDEQPIGRPKIVGNRYKQRLYELATSSPKEHGHSFSRWTAKWLGKHLAEELGIAISDRHVNRLLKQMGLSTRKSNKPQKGNPPVIRGQIITIEDLVHRNLEKTSESIQRDPGI